MRPVRRLAAATAAFAAIIVASPAVAANGDCYIARAATETQPEVRACQLDTWVAQGSQKPGNLAGVNESSTLPTWDTTKPTAQVQSGAGGGYATVRIVDIASPRNRAAAPTFEGTYTGVLDNIAIDMYLTTPVYQATGTSFPLIASLVVDGVEVYSVPAEEVDVPIDPTEAAEGQIGHIRFAFEGLVRALEAVRVENGETTEHQVRFTLMNRYWGDGHTVFFYDEANVPSSVTFNATSLKGMVRIGVL